MRFLNCIMVGLLACIVTVSPLGAIATYTPNDDWWDAIAPPDDRDWAPHHVWADDAWDLTDEDELTNPGMNTIVVAVIDSGIQLDHIEFQNRLWINQDEIPGNLVDDDGNGYVDDVNGWDFVGDAITPGVDDNDPSCHPDGHHGHRVSSIIAAVIDNNAHMTGIAQVVIMPLKTFYYNPTTGKMISGTWNDFEDAIEYAYNNGADVISMSFGSHDETQSLTVLDNELEDAFDHDVVLVAASGNWNDGDDDNSNGDIDLAECEVVAYPARHDDVIAVGAIGVADTRSDYSYWGDDLDLVAPGGQRDPLVDDDNEFVWPLDYFNPGDPDPNLFSCRGTSFACPHVSGTAGLILSYRPTLHCTDVKAIIEGTAEDIIAGGPGGDTPGDGWDEFTGFGLLNTFEALQVTINYQSEWTEPKQDGSCIGDGAHRPCVRVDDEGNSHYVWIDDATGKDQVYYKKMSASGLTTHTKYQVSDDTNDCSWPSLDTNNDGTKAYISWLEQTDTDAYDLQVCGIETEPLNPPVQIFMTTAVSGDLRNTVTLSHRNGGAGIGNIYVVYSIRETQLLQTWNIKIVRLDPNGNVLGIWTMADSNNHEGYFFSADMAYVVNADYIYVAWEQTDTTTGQMDVFWQRINMNGVKAPANPVLIYSNTFYEGRPDIRVEQGTGRSHIVYEFYGNSYDLSQQQIHYVCLDHNGNFLVLPWPVGVVVQHSLHNPAGPDGKVYPQIDIETSVQNHMDVANDRHTVIHVFWREWEDDYEPLINQVDDDGDGIVDETGYQSIFHSCIMLKDEIFSNNLGIRDLTYGYQEVVYKNVDDIEGTGVLVDVSISNLRHPQVGGQHFDLDNRIHLAFQVNTVIGQPTPNYGIRMAGSEAFWGTTPLIQSDGNLEDPDITFSRETNDYHIVACGKNVQPGNPINQREIYCYNTIFNNWALISNAPTIQNPNDPESISPCIDLINIMVENPPYGWIVVEAALVVWVDLVNAPNNQGEVWGVLLHPVFMAPLWGPFMLPSYSPAMGKTPSNPAIVVSQLMAPVPSQIAHVVYSAQNQIFHIGLGYNGLPPVMNPWFVENPVQGAGIQGCVHPSIDTDPTGNVHIVYASNPPGGAWNIYYDRLVPGLNGASQQVLQANNPIHVDDQNGVETSTDPEIKVDRQVNRRSDLQWPDPGHNDRYVHIAWDRTAVGELGHSVAYTKYYINRNVPAVDEKFIFIDRFYPTSSAVNVDMALTYENQVYICFNGETLASKDSYADMSVRRLFYVMLDNNGEVLTTISYISTQPIRGPGVLNKYDVLNFGCAVNHLGWLFVVHDYFKINAPAQFTGHIDLESMVGMYEQYIC